MPPPVVDFRQLATDALFVAETLAAQGEHGQAVEAGQVGCLICDAIWRIREVAEKLRIEVDLNR